LRAIDRIAPPGSFKRGVSVLVGGTAASQVLLFAAAPILTRLYAPDDFGLLALYAALLGIGGVVVSLRYQLAIPLPGDDQEAASVALAALFAVLGTVAASGIVVVLFRQPIATGLNAPELGPLLWLLPVGLLALGLYQVFKYWAIRVEDFGPVARSKITQAVSAVALQLGLFPLGPIALVLGQAAGHGAGGGRLAKTALAGNWSLFRRATPRSVWASAVRYRRFPLYSTWGAAFNKLGWNLPALALAPLFSPAVAGVYLLTHRVLVAPQSFLGEAVGQVFLSRAAESDRSEELGALVRKLVARLAVIGLPPTLAIMIVGPQLFDFVFGPQWRQAGDFARWMAPWLFLVFLTSPLSTLFSVLERQSEEMLFQGGLLVGRVIALLGGAALGDALVAVAFYALVNAAGYAFLLLWIGKASGVGGGPMVRVLARPTLSSTLVVSPLGLLLFPDPGWTMWLFGVGLATVLYAGAISSCIVGGPATP